MCEAYDLTPCLVNWKKFLHALKAELGTDYNKQKLNMNRKKFTTF